MDKINKWLEQFVSAWKNHDVDGAVSLFSSDVEYWETPFYKLSDSNNLKSEWEAIKKQKDISISYDVFSRDENKYTIKWDLEYKNEENIVKKSRGVYLVRLNGENKCDYFFYCSVPEKR